MTVSTRIVWNNHLNETTVLSFFLTGLHQQLTACSSTGQNWRRSEGQQKRGRRIQGDSGGREAEPGRRRRLRCGSGEGAEAMASRATEVATADGQVLSLGRRWRHKGDDGGSKRGFRKTYGRRTGSGRWLARAHYHIRCAGVESQTVRELCRPSDKPGITILVRVGAHVYTITAVFTPYLKLVARCACWVFPIFCNTDPLTLSWEYLHFVVIYPHSVDIIHISQNYQRSVDIIFILWIYLHSMDVIRILWILSAFCGYHCHWTY